MSSYCQEGRRQPEMLAGLPLRLGLWRYFALLSVPLGWQRRGESSPPVNVVILATDTRRIRLEITGSSPGHRLTRRY